MSIHGNLAEQAPIKKVINSRFGEISVNLENTINFPFGLLGFEGFKQYVLAEFPSNNLPGFKILQSVEDDELSFVVLPLSQKTELIEQHNIDDCAEIFNITRENMAIFVIASATKTQEKTKVHVNLRAPIILDTSDKMAIQHVFPSRKYPLKYYLD